MLALKITPPPGGARQTGYHVPRRFGWDCHGLPIEFEIEKMLAKAPPRASAPGGFGPRWWLP